jgi:transcriptional regulator with XRE-family HTH domain
MNTTTHYALHIDDLRISKGLTVHELCEGICDDSTYRRYKTGKKDIPIYKIKMFCDKLELDLDEFLSNTMSKTSIEYKKIFNLYYAMLRKDWKTISDFIHKNLNIEFFYPSNKTLYTFIANTYLYHSKQVSENEYLQTIIHLLPKNFNTVSFNDVIILEKVSSIEVDP